MILTSPSGCEEPWFLGSFAQPCAQPAYQVIIITEIGASALTKRFLCPNFYRKRDGGAHRVGELVSPGDGEQT